jgi:hypothetical protein
MANLTPVEYINIQFPNRGFELISAVRVDSPTSKWKPTVQRVVVLIKVAKKEAMTATLWTNEFESDGTTLKKQGTGYYFHLEDGVAYDKSKSEMETLVSDKQEQLKILNRRIAEINGGGWVITQDPWDPNVVPKSLAPDEPVKTTVTEKPIVQADTSGTSGTSGTSIQTEPQIYGEFTFNVEDAFLFKGNQEFDLLEILYKGLTKEEVEVIEEEEIDEEYEEDPYSAEEEVAMELADTREEARLRNEAAAASLKETDQIGEDVPGSSVKQKDVKEAIITVMDILIKEGGFTKEQAAGICGNIKAESAFKYWNVEDGTANVRPGGMSSDRWDSKRAYGKHYNGGKSSGIGLAQWTYSRRYKMEKYVGEYLADKGISAKTLKARFLDTDPGLHSGDLSTVYGGAGNSLETYLKTIDKLFEAQCSFLQHELKTSYSGIIKTFNGSSPSGNSKRLIKKGFFINQTEGKVAQTVAGYAECVVCDFEVPQPITGGDKDKYKNLVKERTKHAADCLATYNSK